MNLFHVETEGTHAEHQIVTDGTSEYLVEMVTPDVGTGIDSGRVFFFAVPLSAWVNHLAFLVSGMEGQKFLGNTFTTKEQRRN